MLIAQALKNENIVEYLLYMWQIEDLIRAYNLDIDLINEKLILPYPTDEDNKKELYEWYKNLIEMMRLENVQKKGHLQINKNIIINLEELHYSLLKSNNAAYQAKFYQVLPLITHLRDRNNDTSDLGDIELCFNFQYGFMLLKMKESDISKETMQSQKQIAVFLILLAKNYNLYKKGELEIDSH